MNGIAAIVLALMFVVVTACSGGSTSSQASSVPVAGCGSNGESPCSINTGQQTVKSSISDYANEPQQ